MHPEGDISNQSPIFEAVSYCWGNRCDQTNIICNGELLPIPKNLAGALRGLRYPDKKRILWADAICINQSDAIEKEHQVRLMRTIFSLAQDTLIWLGEADDGAKQMSAMTRRAIKFG